MLQKVFSQFYHHKYVAATARKNRKTCELIYLRILSLNLDKLDRRDFDWNVILKEQKGG